MLLLPAAGLTQEGVAVWPVASRESRPWIWWGWLGSAATETQLTGALEELSAAGFGGVELSSMYGVKGAESITVPYLSQRWVQLVRHSLSEAKRLGLGVDLPTVSGWRIGGPDVPAAHVNTAIRFDSNSVSFVGSGDRVKRAGPGGQGLAIDVFSRAAVGSYLDSFARRIGDIPTRSFRAFYNDSFEYTRNGSHELLAEFRRLRGYGLLEHADALRGNAPPDVVARVKSDYRQTLDDMLLENFARPFAAWSLGHGSVSRSQEHGSPGNLLDLYAAHEIPETETFGTDHDPLIQKFASSAGHIAGRRLISAEAMTWLGEHFWSSLSDIKVALDQLFLTGVNHVVYHGNTFSPPDAEWPGWLFYASVEFNSRNPFWRDLPALNAYVTRVQSMLQAARPDPDLLVYWPVWDTWHDTTGLRMDFRVHRPTWFHENAIGPVARSLWEAGYGFDYVSDRLLASHVGVSSDRALIVPSGTRYRAIVVPPTVRIPVETFGRLMALARGGATVIFVGAVPSDVPGLSRHDERGRALESALGQLRFSSRDSQGVRRARVEKGVVIQSETLTGALAAAGVPREGMVDRPGIRFLRQRFEGGRQYFITNSGTEAHDGWLSVAEAKSVVLMDPLTGRSGLAATRRAADGRTEVGLQLEPGASIFVRTVDKPLSRGERGIDRWACRTTVGEPIPQRGRWRVTFMEGGPALPASFETDSLVAWTGRGDAEADRFAGTARYSIRFDDPGGASNFVLDLGRVAESARVRLNGRELAVLFARPFRVETGRLRPMGNVLEIEVTNVAANRIRDLDRRGVEWRIFHDINFVNLAYRAFDASVWPLRPSGLLGPVFLQAVRVAGEP